MASGDAQPLPAKNVAWRVTFPIYDADGDPVSGATGLDSEVSKDGGAFADCTSEATEIGSSGIYYLDLTSTEMNADTVAIQVKSSGKTTVIVVYPDSGGDVVVDLVAGAVDATAIATDAIDADAVAASAIGASEIAADAIGASELATDAIGAAEIAADAIGASELATDAIGAAEIAANAITSSEVADNSIDAGAIAADAIGASEIAASAIGASEIATGAVDADALAADAVDEILDEVVEGALTLRNAVRLVMSFAAGKVSGGGTSTITWRDTTDAKNRITMTVDASGNRTAVTLDGS